MANEHKLEATHINPQEHVKMWFSKNGIPEKHMARFLRFKQLNPDATLRIIYAKKYLEPGAEEKMQAFARKAGIILVDYESIVPTDEYETRIKQRIDHELDYYFKEQGQRKGNLSVVSDQLRLFKGVLKLGIHSDCDVEFTSQLPKAKIKAELGLIAKTRLGVHGNKGELRISNDMTAGDPDSPVSETARRLTCEQNDCYHKLVAEYFREKNIPFDEQNYFDHPDYYRARNEKLSEFSLSGGPQLFAIALDEHGISTGYEGASDTELQTIQIENNQHKLVPYKLKHQKTAEETKQDFTALLPLILKSALVASWDHSWQEGNESWKQLQEEEEEHLHDFMQKLVNDADDDAKILLASKAVPVPKQRVSPLKTYLSSFFVPYLPGRRDRNFEDLTPGEQKYVLKNEKPDLNYRSDLEKIFGKSFIKHAKKFSENGVLILPEFFQGKTLQKLKTVFEKEINKKEPHPFLKQTAFNASVASDGVEDSTVQEVVTAAMHPGLQKLIAYHLEPV